MKRINLEEESYKYLLSVQHEEKNSSHPFDEETTFEKWL
jgi:hypothetical protein